MRTRLPLMTIFVLLFAFAQREKVTYASDAQNEIEMVQLEARTIQASEEAAEIVLTNRATIENDLSGVIDVASITAITAEEIRIKMDQYYIPDAAIYLDGILREEGDLDPIINRRNVSALVDPIELRYGIITKNTALRTYPSWQKLSAETEERATDYFQKSLLLIGEGIAVLHQTEDGIWSFIQSANDFGWVETDSIAFCRREEMDAFANADSFVIFTEEALLVGSKEFKMGTKLPLLYFEGESAVILLPESNDNGNLYQTELRLNKEGGLNVGNMELNVDNVLKQAYKLINVAYGNGGADGMIDDVSMLTSIYRCFGIILPSDANKLMHIGASITDISLMGPEEKRKFIIEQGPGCILQMDGHVVFYLGLSAEGKPMILNSVDNYSVDSINFVESYKCVVTPLETYAKDGRNYLECYQYLIDFNLPESGSM